MRCAIRGTAIRPTNMNMTLRLRCGVENTACPILYTFAMHCVVCYVVSHATFYTGPKIRNAAKTTRQPPPDAYIRMYVHAHVHSRASLSALTVTALTHRDRQRAVRDTVTDDTDGSRETIQYVCAAMRSAMFRHVASW